MKWRIPLTWQRYLGILSIILLLYAALLATDPTAGSAQNYRNLARRVSLSSVLALGAGVLIVAGGIDLSIGSVIGLAAVVLALLLKQPPFFGLVGGEWAAVLWPWAAALLTVLGGCFLGLIHGLLVTRMRLQPFLVTLCGLFIYRGLAQWVAGGRQIDLADVEHLEGLKFWVLRGSWLDIPVLVFVVLALAAVVAVFLHLSVYGRYLYALGYNEQAARYAGVATNRFRVVAYVLCSALAGLYGVFYLMEQNSVSPTDAGSGQELYAITGAVLGGCSLRGGEGTVLGIVLGAAVLPLLENLCNFARVSNLRYAVIGFALLVGTIINELLQRRAAARV